MTKQHVPKSCVCTSALVKAEALGSAFVWRPCAVGVMAGQILALRSLITCCEYFCLKRAYL